VSDVLTVMINLLAGLSDDVCGQLGADVTTRPTERIRDEKMARRTAASFVTVLSSMQYVSQHTISHYCDCRKLANGSFSIISRKSK